MALIAVLQIGRAWCPACRVVRQIVYPPDVEEVRCPTCGELVTMGACGDEEE